MQHSNSWELIIVHAQLRRQSNRKLTSKRENKQDKKGLANGKLDRLMSLCTVIWSVNDSLK